MGWVAAHGKILLVPDVSQDPRYISTISSTRTHSEVALPIRLKEQIIGVLNVESDQLNAFDSNDVAVLEALANQLAVAIENARLYEQARQLAALEERQKLARELHDSVRRRRLVRGGRRRRRGSGRGRRGRRGRRVRTVSVRRVRVLASAELQPVGNL